MNTITQALAFNDVLLVPQYSPIKSRSDVDLSTKIVPTISLSIPLISINMDTVTDVDMAVAMHQLGGIGMLPRFDNPENQAAKVAQITKRGSMCIPAMGIRDDYIKRVEMLLAAGAKAITMDIAHAHTGSAIEAIKTFKNRFTAIPLLAGTIATYQGAYDLFTAGADAVRVGVEVGTICTTRIMTGSGMPQITALMEAKRAADQFKNKYIIADGGTANSGDIVKALACGASAVISGSLYAGTGEAPGKRIEVNGKQYKEYNGSTSKTEKMKQLQKDATGKEVTYALHVEGVEAMVPAKGPVKHVIESLCAGIRSGLTYSGARTIEELWEKAQFVQITQAGYRESQAHDVIVR
jgi:IMP dehydrogenase